MRAQTGTGEDCKVLYLQISLSLSLKSSRSDALRDFHVSHLALHLRLTGSGAHTASTARWYRLKAHSSSTPPRKQPEPQDDPPHLRRNAEPPRAAEKTVIRNALRTMRAGKGAAAAPEVRASRIDSKSMMFSINSRIIILLIIILSSVKTEPHSCNRFYHIKKLYYAAKFVWFVFMHDTSTQTEFLEH